MDKETMQRMLALSTMDARIRLAGKLDDEKGLHRIGPELWADGNETDEGEWDLTMTVAENWIGCDRGEGIPCRIVGVSPGLAYVTVVQEEGDALFGFTFAIDCKYVELDQGELV